MLNVIHGGPATGRVLVDAPVDGVGVHGLPRRQGHRAQAPRALARPALTEMGGKNPAIVAASADIEGAAEGVARSAFGPRGQKCSACSRAIVLDEVHDEFVERIAEFSSSSSSAIPPTATPSSAPSSTR